MVHTARQRWASKAGMDSDRFRRCPQSGARAYMAFVYFVGPGSAFLGGDVMRLLH
jgi:hypothetical protein